MILKINSNLNQYMLHHYVHYIFQNGLLVILMFITYGSRGCTSCVMCIQVAVPQPCL